MTGPIIQALRHRLPKLRLTIRSDFAHTQLLEHISPPFDAISTKLDQGMVMIDALRVDLDASWQYYRALHEDFPARVSEAAQDLAVLKPDLLLSNIPYLGLAAAQRLGIPNVAVCCLNWADIFDHYCGAQPGAEAISNEIRQTFARADAFIAPAPAMSMADLNNVKRVGPIARRARSLARHIKSGLGLSEDTRLVLISLGGVPFRIDVAQWPAIPKVHYILASDHVMGKHPQVTWAHTLSIGWIDLLGSADVVITKLGYGTVAEAAVNGVALLYVKRDGWPEEPYARAWLEANGRCHELPLEALLHGTMEQSMHEVLALSSRALVQPSGAEEAAELILSVCVN